MHAVLNMRKNQVWVGRIALAGRGGRESHVWMIMPQACLMRTVLLCQISIVFHCSIVKVIWIEDFYVTVLIN